MQPSELRHRQRTKMPNFQMAAKWIRTRTLSIENPALSYCTPQQILGQLTNTCDAMQYTILILFSD